MADLRGRSRRNFLTQCLTGAVALGAGANFRSPAQQAAPAAKSRDDSRVVVALDPDLRGSGLADDPRRGADPARGVDLARIEVLLDRAMLALFSHEHPAATTPENTIAAWRHIAGPGDTVSLKVNTLGGRGISTNVELVDAVCERLQQAGVKPANIVVWDRDSEELERAGFGIAIGGDRVQCYGTDRVGLRRRSLAYGAA